MDPVALALLDTQQFNHFTLFETADGWQASVSVSDVATWHVCTEPTPEAAIRAVFDLPAPVVLASAPAGIAPAPFVLSPPPY
jgi:hypothetical protein